MDLKISACMIVKNEESNIERCINSYKDIVDEIIVVDTGSTDNTIAIAEKSGAKVYFRKWDNDFAAAKNFAIDLAGGSWIIFLDADEYFSEGSLNHIVKSINEIDHNEAIDALMSRRYNIQANSNEVIDDEPIIRIFRNKSIRWEGTIHEELRKSGEPLRTYKITEEIKIFHTGYFTEIVKSKAERNIELLEAEIRTGKSKTSTYFYLCESYFILKKYQESLKYGKICLAQKDVDFVLERTGHFYRIYIYTVLSMEMAGGHTYLDKYEIVKKSIDKFFFHPEIKGFEADFYYHHGQLDLALESYFQAIRLNEQYDAFFANRFDGALFNVYTILGNIYLLKNETSEAFDYYIKSLKIEKYSEYSLEKVIGMIKNQNAGEVIQLLNTIYDQEAIKDVQFLAKNLAMNKAKDPFLYYFLKKWQGGYEDYGFLVAVAMILTGDPQKALETVYECYLKEKNEQYELFTVAFLIFINDERWYQNHKQELSGTYSMLLAFNFGEIQCSDLSESDNTAFLKILPELILLDDLSFAEKYVDETGHTEIAVTVGDKLMKADKYIDAIAFCQKALIFDKDEGKGRIYQNIAFCCYKLNRYEESIENYERALTYGYIENYKVIQILEWIERKVTTPDIKNRVKKLADAYLGILSLKYQNID